MVTDAFVRLFGGPLVVAGEVQPALTPAQRRLLAIVYASAPDPVTREEVSWLLWEEGETAETRHRLRQLIYAINRLHPTPVLERRGDVIVPRLPTDAHDVEPGLGHPLRLVTSTGNASFEHWLDTTRTRLSRNRRRHFAAALDRAMAVRDPDAVCLAARTVISVDPSSCQGAALDLAWGLLTLGRYREAEHILRDAISSIGDGDASALMAALARIRTAQPLSEPHHDPQSGAMIGRRTLVERITHSFYSSPNAALILYGPMAIGKSTLLSAIYAAFGLRFPTCPVLQSTEEWRFGPYPFGMIQDLLLSPWFLDGLPSQEPLSPVLAAAFPRLTATRGSQGDVRSVDPTPTAISRDLRQLLHTALDGRPLLVIVDDLGAADESSCKLLCDAVADPRLQVRLLGAVTASSPNALQSQLSRLDPRLTKLPSQSLPELTPDDSVALIRTSNKDISPGDARQMYRALGGVPGHLLEAAATSGPLRGLPASLQQVAEERLQRVNSADRFLCSILAVSGGPTSVGILSEVSGNPLHITSAAIERLVEAGLCCRQAGGVWFAQRFIATAAYERLESDERRGIHHSLLVAEQANPGVGSQRIQRHASAAGEESPSLHPLLVSEAAAAESVGALPEAAELWWKASAVSPSADAEAAALVRHVDILLRLRRYDRAGSVLDDAITRVGDTDLGARLRLRKFMIESRTDPGKVTPQAARALVAYLRDRGSQLDFALGLETTLRAADMLADVPLSREFLEIIDSVELDDPEAGVWLALAKTRHLYLGDGQRGLESAMTAVRRAEALGNPDTLGRALNRLIVAMVFRGRMASPEGRATLTRCREVAEEFGDTVLMYDSYVNEGSWHMDVGDFDSASSCFSKAEQLAAMDTTRIEALTMLINRGELLLHQGRGPEALTFFEKAYDHAVGEGTGRILCAAGMSLASLESGSLRGARKWIRSLEQVSPSDRFRGNISLVALAKARLAQAEGRHNAAVTELLLFADSMIDWMIPAAVKLYLEAFRLALRLNVPLEPDLVERVTNLVDTLALPGNGQRILHLRPRLMERDATLARTRRGLQES